MRIILLVRSEERGESGTRNKVRAGWYSDVRVYYSLTIQRPVYPRTSIRISAALKKDLEDIQAAVCHDLMSMGGLIS